MMQATRSKLKQILANGKVYDLTAEMRKEFREIGEMANRQAYEYILPWQWFSRWRKNEEHSEI